ncbi:MAG: hypothetical protein GC159_12095 [Phycisphaera sp.]|nr:hypothetical protein [Phycisphaera sp.]
MAMERHFLGWTRPGLPAACDWLIGRYGVNLHNVTAVLPGGRAGRRLMELLVDAAAERGEPLVPPRIVTVGRLAEQLIPLERVADDAARALMWTQALRGLSPAERDTLIPHPPGDDDVPGWATLAAEIERLHTELIGEGVSFADVTRATDEMDAPGEAARWGVLEAVARRYLDLVASVDLADPQTARWRTLHDHAATITTDRDIVIVAAADLNKMQRQLLGAVADRVSVLVHAPEDRADDFDAHGCVIVERWAEATLDLDDGAHLRVVQRPIDQSMQAVREIASLDGAYPAEQITIGVCDDAVAPYLLQMLPGYDLKVRYAARTPIDRTGPMRLLSAAAEYIEHRRFADFAALIRHPDLRDWLLEHGAPGGGPLHADAIDTWLGLMDDYYTRHLQQRLTGRWLGDDDTRAALKAVYDAVHHAELLGELLGEPREDDDTPAARPLSKWAEPIAKLLITVYGRTPVDRTDDAGRVIIETCESVRDALAAYHRLPAGIDVELDAAAALRLVVSRVAGGFVPPEADQAAIEMLGPLELPLDDAEVCLVSGFNEGCLPESTHGDALLPDGLRAQLGVFDNRRRYARDVYAVTTMRHSKRVLKLIAGRRDASGDPLRPSRLMFAADPDTIARRIQRFYGDEGADDAASHAPARLTRWSHAAASGFAIPPVLRVKRVPEYLRVTDFRAYLDCPYRFALSRLMRLGRIDDTAAEMDAMLFGTVTHKVLQRFAVMEAAKSTDAEAVAQVIGGLVDAVIGEEFGDEPLPAVIVQREQLKQRLRGFARWQAEWAADGWVIRHAERVFSNETAGVLELGDGESIRLHGTIDRIDYNERRNTWAVLDYKTSDKAKEPGKEHRKKDGEWKDLQLPLYRVLLRSLTDARGRRVLDAAAMDTLKLGYVALPKDTRTAGAKLAKWSADDLDDAENEAKRIAVEIREAIRSGAIAEWRPQDVSTPWDEFAWLCGVGQMSPPGENGDDEEGGGDDAGGDA